MEILAVILVAGAAVYLANAWVNRIKVGDQWAAVGGLIALTLLILAVVFSVWQP